MITKFAIVADARGLTVFWASGLSLSVLCQPGSSLALWAYRGVELASTRLASA